MYKVLFVIAAAVFGKVLKILINISTMCLLQFFIIIFINICSRAISKQRRLFSFTIWHLTSESGERNVLSLSVPCHMRDKMWSWKKLLTWFYSTLLPFYIIDLFLYIETNNYLECFQYSAESGEWRCLNENGVS